MKKISTHPALKVRKSKVASLTNNLSNSHFDTFYTTITTISHF